MHMHMTPMAATWPHGHDRPWHAHAADVHRVLSEERYVHHGPANLLGLHLLRCLLAERAIDASRALRGHTLHPDYQAFSQQGLLHKDFRTLDNGRLRSLMAMVSGFAEETLPASIAWELRSTSMLADDPNLDLHVDTVRLHVRASTRHSPPVGGECSPVALL